MGDFANEADQGFIVFTLGSNAKVSAMPEHIKNMFVRVFARIPQRVFWKWEMDNLAVNTLPASVKIVNWLPQQDLLGTGLLFQDKIRTVCDSLCFLH